MTHRSEIHLHAATVSGAPALSVVDFSTGGLLVEAPIPFDIGAVVHLRLSTADGVPCGTFALRCLHTHRTDGADRTPAHISALVFIHPLDVRTRALLAGPGHAPDREQAPESPRVLRFADSPGE